MNNKSISFFEKEPEEEIHPPILARPPLQKFSQIKELLITH